MNGECNWRREKVEEKERGRGMIMGIRKELMEERTVIEGKEEGIMIGRVKRGEEK